MRTELLSIPGRRETILPELTEFFNDRDPSGRMLEDFVSAFAGTTFTMPGPETLRECRRDEQIVAELSKDQSAQARLALLRKHGISYSHMAGIWAACEGWTLEPPPPAPGRTPLEEAASWIAQHRSQVNDIVAMYGMNALERQKAVAMAEKAGAKVSAPTDLMLSALQKRVLEAVIRMGPVEPNQIKTTKKAPTNTLKSLEQKELVKRQRNGYVATTRGRQAVGGGG